MRYKQRVDAVTQFLERDDNSTCTCLPGKRDKMTTKIDTAQTRILNDYMLNHHFKFKAENPNMNISFTAFSCFRPAYVKLVRHSARSTCLC